MMDDIMILASRDALAGGDVAETNLALTIIFPFIATIVVAGRFYARRLKRMTPGYDDWIMLLAIVLHLAQMSMGILRDVEGGFGVPTSKLTPHQLKMLNQASAANNVFYPVILTLARLSITVLVIKIFSVSSLRWAGYANIVFCIAWLIFCTLTGMLRCQPISKSWHKEASYPGHCGDELPVIIRNAAWNIVCEFTTAIIPTIGVWRLQLNRVHKWGLTAVFALAFMVFATSAARIGITVVAQTKQVSAGYSAARTNLSFVETSLSIIVACAPTLRPIFTKTFHLYTSPLQSNMRSGGLPRHHRPHERKGFESLPDAYGLEEGYDKKSKTATDTIIPLGDVKSTNATRADGSPVPTDLPWGRDKDESDDEQHIKVLHEVSISTNKA